MRTLVAALVLLAQAQSYPPPYPRAGTTKLLENDRVIVWDVSWLKQPYPTHRHQYDYTGVYYTNGDRIIVSEQGARSPTHSVAWDTFFLKRGITHSEEGASDQPLRGVFLELKEPEPLGVTDSAASAPAFPGTSGKQIRDSERATIWEFVPAPGPTSSPHRHVRDAVVVAFTGLTPTPIPRVNFVAHGATHSDEQTTGADRAYVLELK